MEIVIYGAMLVTLIFLCVFSPEESERRRMSRVQLEVNERANRLYRELGLDILNERSEDRQLAGGGLYAELPEPYNHFELMESDVRYFTGGHFPCHIQQ